MRWLLVFVAACWTGSQAPPLPPPQPTERTAPSTAFRSRPPQMSCETTIERIADRLRDEIVKSQLPVSTADELVEVSVESCLAMAWSPDLLGCLDHVNDSTEMNACNSLLTTEQSEDLTRRWMDVISRMSQQQQQQTP